MLLAFELSGEHRTIPVSEVSACLESLKIGFSSHLSLDGCLILDLKEYKDEITGILLNRLSMTHHILKVLGTGCQDEEEIVDLVKASDLDFDCTYSVRVRRIKDYSTISTGSLEKRIGKIFYEKGFRADLKNPGIQFRLLLTENKAIFGYVLGSVNRGSFEERKPHHKPFFYPGVLMPKVARALVNIARPEKNLFDPFCGTGGILVEAGLLGIHIIGSDVQRKLLLGARMNLDHYKTSYSLMYQDACRLSLREGTIDAVVTDPPYGRSALIKAESIENLLSGSMKEIHRVLIKGKRAIFISERPIEDIAKGTGFKVVETHLQRVHKSLTRYILVLEK